MFPCDVPYHETDKVMLSMQWRYLPWLGISYFMGLFSYFYKVYILAFLQSNEQIVFRF